MAENVTISWWTEGKKVTWMCNSDSEGGPVTVVYKGTVRAAKQG